MAWRGAELKYPTDVKAFAGDVNNETHPSWANIEWNFPGNGGKSGVIREFAGMLIVVQTSENHRQIRNLLYQLRHPEPPEPARAGSTKPSRSNP